MYYLCVTHFPTVYFPSCSRHALIGAVSSWRFHSLGLNPVLLFACCFSFLSFLSFLLASHKSLVNKTARGEKIKLYRTRGTFSNPHGPRPPHECGFNKRHSDTAVSPPRPSTLSLSLSDVTVEDSLFISIKANDSICKHRCPSDDSPGWFPLWRQWSRLAASFLQKLMRHIYLFCSLWNQPRRAAPLCSDSSPLCAARPLYFCRRPNGHNFKSLRKHVPLGGMLFFASLSPTAEMDLRTLISFPL